MALQLISAAVNDGGKGPDVSWLARVLEALEAERAGDGLNALAASRAVVIGTRQNEGLPICKVIILINLTYI